MTGSGRIRAVVLGSAAIVGLMSSAVPAAAQSSLGTVTVDSRPVAQPMPVAGEGSIRAIDVQGSQRVEPDTIKAYMGLKEGDRYSPDTVDKAIKSLFATGLFADVAIGFQNDQMIVKVTENPIINRVAFEGNKRVEEKALQSEVQLKARQVYTRSKVQEDVKRVLDVYRRSGRFAVTVEPKVIQLEQNRLDLVFEINEGPSTYVRRIDFVGNKRYSDSALRDVVSTREERWYRFFSSSDTYDPDRTTYDRELLRRYYLRNGYSDFRIVSSVAELTPDRTGFFMTFTLEEGERYKFGELKVDVKIPDLQAEELMPSIKAVTGDWYNADLVENTVQAITDRVGALGYAFVDVRPRVKRDKANKVVDIVFEVQEGPKVFVERIDIGGNMRTLDRVIRREMQLVEGDAFNSAKLRRSREKLRNLGFFEKVEVTNVPSETAPDRTVVQVDVREKSTGELSFGVGWSSSDGALFDVTLRERNLLGRGQDIRLKTTIAQRKSEIDLSFTEPYFMDRPLAAGIDLFARDRDYQKTSSYNLKDTGATLRMGFNYDEHWRQTLRYTLSQSEVSDVASTASTFVKQREGEYLLSMFGQTLSYDRRDNVIEPSDGYVVKLSTDVAGAGGDEQFVRGMLDGAHYTALTDETVLMLQGSFGAIQGVGQDVMFIRNYQLGGDNLRGFRAGGASPRDKSTADVLGGTWIGSVTAEVRFPLGLPEELGISGKAFSDAGMIGKPDGVRDSEMNFSSSVRASAGVGIIWKSPMGPVSIDLAQPLMKENFDKDELFRFNFGTQF